MGVAGTPSLVPSALSSAASHIYVLTTPYLPLLCVPTIHPLYVHILLPATTSPPFFASPPPPYPTLASHQPTSTHAACGPVAPWHSSADALTPIPFVWSADGAPMPCSATCTPKPYHSFATFLVPCSSMVRSLFFPAPTVPPWRMTCLLRPLLGPNHLPTHPSRLGLSGSRESGARGHQP